MDEPKVQRIGLLTGGGDCPGLNAVIRAVVKTAINEYGLEVLGIEDGFEGLMLPGKVYPLDLQSVRGILPRGGTILGTTNRANPFNYQVQAIDEQGKGVIMTVDLSARVVDYIRALEIDTLIVVGGDGSLHIAAEFQQMGVPVIGIPKTIDNDLPYTDLTFGFDTALDTAMEALDKLHTTAESHHRVIVLEVMGRNAGWIALEAGIAGGADVILIPEIPYSRASITEKIHARNERGAEFSLVVVAEGAHPEGGEAVYHSGQAGSKRLGGIGEALASQIQELTEIETRVTVLGHLQRGGSPTAFDRLLGSRFGTQAVHYAAAGQSGIMVALQGETLVPIPLEKAVERQKLVPLDSDILRTARGLGICLGD